MRQTHRAGERAFVDYTGQKPQLVDSTTGAVIAVELFVGVLGASNYTYAEATRTQQLPDWLGSHERMFRYFGGVTVALVCDQLKSSVTRPCRYEPGLQRTYEESAAFLGTTILPARPAMPRDKVKVEVAVQVAERCILAQLRHETFFALGALNARIPDLLEELNQRCMRHYEASRRELFERLDRPALRPLPAAPFVYGEGKRATLPHQRRDRDREKLPCLHTRPSGVPLRLSGPLLAGATALPGLRARAGRWDLWPAPRPTGPDGRLGVGRFCLGAPEDPERRDLLEILEDRYGTRSTIITS